MGLVAVSSAVDWLIVALFFSAPILLILGGLTRRARAISRHGRTDRDGLKLSSED
jgi:hypothetical protein